jgi:hypothetical protein
MTTPRHYRSKQWFEFRQAALLRHDHSCEHCGQKKQDGAILQIHHPVYYQSRMPWQYEVSEIEVLCRGCHAKEHGLIQPSTDWNLTGEDDLGAPDGECEYCGREIRNVYFIEHPNWQSLVVGSGCCEKLCESKFESEYKRKVDRRSRFLAKSNWLDNEDGTSSAKHRKFHIRLVPTCGKVYFVINDVTGRKEYDDPLYAKWDLFEKFESSKIKEYFEKHGKDEVSPAK